MAVYHVVIETSSDAAHPQTRSFEADAEVPLLVSAERAGLAWASSCRNGTCRTCLRQLRSGSVSYRIAWPGLTPDEKAQGWVLPCVAHPASDLHIAAPTQAPWWET